MESAGRSRNAIPRYYIGLEGMYLLYQDSRARRGHQRAILDSRENGPGILPPGSFFVGTGAYI
jgi:hypothetical protein